MKEAEGDDLGVGPGEGGDRSSEFELIGRGGNTVYLPIER